MKKLVLLLGIMLFFVSCQAEEQEFANPSTSSEAAAPTIEHVSIPLTDSQLLELFRNMSPLAQTRVAVFYLSSKEEIEYWSTVGPGVLVVHFGASWSGPCKLYRSTFAKVANDYPSQACYFGYVDIDDLGAQVTAKYGVRAAPTTLIIKYNTIVATAVGRLEETTLKALVDQYKNTQY